MQICLHQVQDSVKVKMNDLFNLRMRTRMVLEVETALSLIKPMSLSTLSDRCQSLFSLHI